VYVQGECSSRLGITRGACTVEGVIAALQTRVALLEGRAVEHLVARMKQVSYSAAHWPGWSGPIC
jgi:hypothetical protein